MTRHEHEPLTPEERALAERLARLGSHGGPSPALDAKILAAAHEAVFRTPRRQRRGWLGLGGGAGGLVTGLGLAASLTVVLGVVWQLRPGDTMLPQMSEGAAGDVEHVILVDDLPSSEPRTRIVESPPSIAAPAPDRTSAMPPAEARKAESAVRHQREEARAASERASSERHAAEHGARAAASEATAEAKALQRADPEADAQQGPASAAPAAFPAAAPVEPAPAPAASAPRRATYTRNARAQAERAARQAEASHDAGQAAQEAPAVHSQPAPAPARAPAPAVDIAGEARAEADETSLDRIVVTGSRIAPVVAIPLHEDARLAASDWLERIRARQAAGDTDTARASLRLFRKAHPRVRLPDDLAELLAAPGSAGPGAP